MADTRNPNEIQSEGWWEPGTAEGLDVPPNVTLPSGVQKTKEYYAHYRVYKDGRREIKWYQRAQGDGKTDPIVTTTTDTMPAIKTAWDKETSTTTDKDDASRKPPGGKQFNRNPDGSIAEWNPDSDPPGYNTPRPDLSSATSTATSPTAQNEAALNNERWWQQNTPKDPSNPAAGGSGFRETHMERREREAADEAKRKAEADKQTAAAATTPKEEVNPSDPTRLRKPDGKGGWTDAGVNAAGVQAAAANAEKNKPTPVLAPDKKSWGYFDNSGPTPRWVTLPASQAPALPGEPKKPPVEIEGEYGTWETSADGQQVWTPVQKQPGAPAGSGNGPSMPEVVIGMTADALRAYDTANRAEVAAGRMTEAQRQRRLQEALQVANVAAGDARLLQAEQQSNLGAAVNLATTKYTLEMSGLNQALTFASQFIGKLPAGSTAGGKAFSAVLGMQALARHRSGIDAITVGPTSGLTPIPGRPGAPGAATKPQAPATLTNPNDPAAVDAQLAQVKTELAAATNTTDAGGVPREFTPASATGTGAVAAPLPAPILGPQPLAAAPTPAAAPVVPPSPVAAPPAPVIPATPSVDPASFGAPEGLPNPPGPVGMMPPPENDYAVLAQSAVPALQSMMMPSSPVTEFDNNPAMLESLAASMPPWRISDADAQMFRANGTSEKAIWGIPEPSWGAA